MTHYRSAFAVASGFAVATRTATKGKTTSAQDTSLKAAKAANGGLARARQASAAASPVLAA